MKVISFEGRRMVAATAATLLVGLVGATGAFADDPSLQGYGGPGGQEQGTVDQGGTQPGNDVLGTTQGGGNLPDTSGNEVLGERQSGGSAPASQPSGATAPAAATAPATAEATNRLVGNLPFTGLDIGLVAAVGLALAALGFGLRRLTHSPQVS
jgi:hypothetical protein